MQKLQNIAIILIAFVSIMIKGTGQIQAPAEKVRIIVLTDIENEPDDAQSLVRFLTYSNEFDVEGLIATTSTWQRNEIADWRILEILEAYGKVRDNLLLHAEGYPTKDFLSEQTKRGLPKFGMAGVGSGQDSDGSEWIIEIVDKPDPRPVWILVWGGPNCLAQALWKIRQTRTTKQLNEFISKIRVYTISDQDDSGPWIRKNFPDLFYIVSPGLNENGAGAYFYATWAGISGERHYHFASGADTIIVDNPWLGKHIRNNHGLLGAEYPQIAYIMEGDSPSFLYLINNGLGCPEKPDYGSWGGRYEFYTPRMKKWFYGLEIRPIWTDAVDKVKGKDGRFYASNQATIWRWRDAYQNDFFARMDWCVMNFDQANHPPIPKLGHPDILIVHGGETVTLNAEGSADPDHDELSFEWLYYKEAGSYPGNIKIQNPYTQKCSFVAPKVSLPKTLHIILCVTDSGTPRLTRYQRVIINILPENP